jgi:hypothetical protein
MRSSGPTDVDVAVALNQNFPEGDALFCEASVSFGRVAGETAKDRVDEVALPRGSVAVALTV